MGGYEVSLRGHEQQRKAPPSMTREAAAQPIKRADPNSNLGEKEGRKSILQEMPLDHSISMFSKAEGS